MDDHGFDEETINELALHNLRVYDKTIDTPENAALVNEMIADGNEGGNTHEKGGILTGIKAFARGWMAGTAGYLAEGFEAYYTWVQSTDISTDSARLRNQYAAQYGIFGGEKELYDELMQMCEEEFFPNEGMNKFVKRYLEEGGNPYLLGIEPGKLGWVAQAANDIKDVQEVHEEWKENQSEGIQDVFNTGSWLGEHVTSALFEKKWISPALGFMGKYAEPAKALITSGAGWYNEGYQKGMEDGYSHGQSQKLGLGYIAGAWVGNSENISSRMVKAIYSKTVEQLSGMGLGRWCSGFAKYYKTLPEKTRDQFKTGINLTKEGLNAYFKDEEGKLGGVIAATGTGMMIGALDERNTRLPSDELYSIVCWY